MEAWVVRKLKRPERVLVGDSPGGHIETWGSLSQNSRQGTLSESSDHDSWLCVGIPRGELFGEY